jgi:hypothetical protein
MSTINAEELAQEVVRMNRAIVRCLHYLAEEIPESRRGDYLVLLNDVHGKHAQLIRTLGSKTDSCPTDLPPLNMQRQAHPKH